MFRNVTNRGPQQFNVIQQSFRTTTGVPRNVLLRPDDSPGSGKSTNGSEGDGTERREHSGLYAEITSQSSYAQHYTRFQRIADMSDRLHGLSRAEDRRENVQFAMEEGLLPVSGELEREIGMRIERMEDELGELYEEALNRFENTDAELRGDYDEIAFWKGVAKVLYDEMEITVGKKWLERSLNAEFRALVDIGHELGAEGVDRLEELARVHRYVSVITKKW